MIMLATSYEVLSHPGMTFVNFPLHVRLFSLYSDVYITIGHNSYNSPEKPHCFPQKYRMKSNVTVFTKVPMVREDSNTIHSYSYSFTLSNPCMHPSTSNFMYLDKLKDYVKIWLLLSISKIHNCNLYWLFSPRATMVTDIELH